jgi:hypothetical protein
MQSILLNQAPQAVDRINQAVSRNENLTRLGRLPDQPLPFPFPFSRGRESGASRRDEVFQMQAPRGQCAAKHLSPHLAAATVKPVKFT